MKKDVTHLPPPRLKPYPQSVYFSQATSEHGEFRLIALMVDQFTDGIGRRWYRVGDPGLAILEQRVEAAKARCLEPGSNLSPQKVAEAIDSLERFRECLETEGASEGFKFLFDWPG